MIRRGLTMVEVVVGLAIVVILIVILIVLLQPLANTRPPGLLRDRNQMKQVHQTFLIWSADHDGLLPTPGRVGLPFRAQEDDVHSLNHTANLYSMMIALEYFNPDMVISPNEVNRAVRLKDDYDWDAYSPEADSFWDATFVARLDDPAIGSNTSYAHLAICGDRQRIHWRDTQNENMPILGTRGTRNGVTSGPEYDRSPTLRLQGPPRVWRGNVVLGDNATETLDGFTRRGTVYDDGSGSRLDNMYAAEFSHPEGKHAAADAFLGIFIEASEFSVVPVYDVLE